MTYASFGAGAAEATVPNNTYEADQVFKPVGFIDKNTGAPKGTNLLTLIRGHAVAVYAPDSGHGDGGLLVYDVSDISRPLLVRSVDPPVTAEVREAHSLPTGRVNGRDILAVQTRTGLDLWDFSEPASPQRLDVVTLPGLTGGDYGGTNWQMTWQGPYIFVSGTGAGLYVLDIREPRNVDLINRVPTGKTGGFALGPIYAMGDFLVVSEIKGKSRHAVLEVSDPRNISLRTTISGDNGQIYSAFVQGSHIYVALRRTKGAGGLAIYDWTPDAIMKRGQGGLNELLYAAYHEGSVFVGSADKFAQIDISDESKPRTMREGSLGRGGADNGQVTPMANLLFVGNDHGNGSGFVPLSTAKDDRAPEVTHAFPANGAKTLATSSRISLCFSEIVDMQTVNKDTITVRPLGGEALDGVYSQSFTTISFGPAGGFETEMVYEVLIKEGGVRDAAGNPISETVRVRFGTGTVDVPIPPPPPLADGGIVDGSIDAEKPAPQPDAVEATDASAPVADASVSTVDVSSSPPSIEPPTHVDAGKNPPPPNRFEDPRDGSDEGGCKVAGSAEGLSQYQGSLIFLLLALTFGWRRWVSEKRIAGSGR